jgi:DNA-binding transcriptional MerR regulator
MGGSIFLSIGQVAKLLNYCDNYVRQHEKRLGLTPTFTGGGHRRYTLDQVLKVKRRVEEGRAK